MNPAVRERLDEVTSGRRRWVVVEGDSREVLSRLWPSGCPLLLTDAPYGISQEGAEITRAGSSSLKQDFGDWDRVPLPELVELLREVIRLAAVAVESGGAAYVFTSDGLFGPVRELLATEFGAQRRGFIAWCKNNPAPSMREAGWLSAAELLVWGRREGNPFNFPGHRGAYNWKRYPAPSGITRRHPTQKPLNLLVDVILAQSQPGDIVLDPFCGGGSTGEAALRHGRRFIGVELDPVYAARAHDHLTQVEKRELDSPAADERRRRRGA